MARRGSKQKAGNASQIPSPGHRTPPPARAQSLGVGVKQPGQRGGRAGAGGVAGCRLWDFLSPGEREGAMVGAGEGQRREVSRSVSTSELPWRKGIWAVVGVKDSSLRWATSLRATREKALSSIVKKCLRRVVVVNPQSLLPIPVANDRLDAQRQRLKILRSFPLQPKHGQSVQGTFLLSLPEMLSPLQPTPRKPALLVPASACKALT